MKSVTIHADLSVQIWGLEFSVEGLKIRLNAKHIPHIQFVPPARAIRVDTDTETAPLTDTAGSTRALC